MKNEKQKRRSGWYWWTLLLPVIYMLSFGPVTKICVEMEQAHLNTEWIIPSYKRYSTRRFLGKQNNALGWIGFSIGISTTCGRTYRHSSVDRLVG